MEHKITTIGLPMPFHLGSVNCYLIQSGEGYLLIDTGMPAGRSELVKALYRAGCQPGNLLLMVITHGDFDHMGNAAYLRQTFGAKIAMHQKDAGMAERGDMFWNRERPNRVIRWLISALFRFSSADRFTPDLCVGDGYELSRYGVNAQVVEIPGHSKGSIGVLTGHGELFCGDLFMNDKDQPALGFGRPAHFARSIERVKALEINMVYPGHGKPFSRHQIPQGG